MSIEETAAGPRLDLFGRSHGLSAREQQLLRLLSRGADTRDIAEEMTITEYTVQDHLKSIFGKTSLTSRNAVLTAALGPGATSSTDRRAAVRCLRLRYAQTAAGTASEWAISSTQIAALSTAENYRRLNYAPSDGPPTHR